MFLNVLYLAVRQPYIDVTLLHSVRNKENETETHPNANPA